MQTIAGNFEIYYDVETQRFHTNKLDLNLLQNTMDKPLSVILQITRKCHFNCKFCSEKENIPDPELDDLKIFASNLIGVPRIFLSGGEPLLRKDFDKVVEIFSDNHIIGLPTNAIATNSYIDVIKNNHISVNVGLDGPRAITSRIRGDYDYIIEGIRIFIKNDIRFSLTAVVLRSTIDSVLYTCQIADALGAKKLKLVLPIPKGNALELAPSEYISNEEAINICNQIADAKKKYGWKTTFTFTIWNEQTEGYSILVYPNGMTYAWPVFSCDDKVLHLGDLHFDTIQDIWNRYPYKENHINKYLGNGIHIM